MAPRRTWDLAHIALGLYVLSLLLPAIVVLDKPLFGGAPQTKVMFGVHCLTIGFFVWPGWLANPLFALAYILHRFDKHAAAAVLMLLAVLSAVLALAILRDLDMMRLESIHVGYVAWVASFVVLLIAAISPPRFRATIDPTA